MATSTPNLGLTLPIGNEHVSRQIINRNMMILDESATNFDFNPDVMRDAILAVQDVTHVKIVLNRSDEEVNGIPAKSLLALVNNGGKTNICQAIYDTNTSGLATTGTLEKEIEGVTIKFSRPSLYALHFNITLEGFTAPSLTNIETSIKNALMTYINRTLQIGEVLSMENVRQIVYNAAGSEAANFRIKDLSCSGSQGVSRDFMDPGWNNKFTMSSGSDVTITSVQSQSSQAIDALNNNVTVLQDEGVYYGTCTTAATTRDKAVTCANFPSALKAGQKLSVKFTYGDESTSYARMTVNSLTRKNIQFVSGSTMLNIWKAGEVVDFVYDGTAWIVASGSTYNRLNENDKVTYSDITKNTGFSGTLRMIKCGKSRVIFGAVQLPGAGLNQVAGTLAEADRPPVDIYGSVGSYGLTPKGEVIIGSNGNISFNANGDVNNTLKFNVSYFVS